MGQAAAPTGASLLSTRAASPPATRIIAAARAWSLFEGEKITLLPDPDLSAHHDDDEFALAFARLETHYFVNDCWLEPNQLLRGADRLRAIRARLFTVVMTCFVLSVTLGHCTSFGPRQTSI